MLFVTYVTKYMSQASINTAVWRWRFHRLLIDKFHWHKPVRYRKKTKRVLFLSELNDIATTQFFPFFYHQADLKLDAVELPLKAFKNSSDSFKSIDPDAVCLQTWFDFTPDDLEALIANLKRLWPGAKLSYFDWFAPTDLRFAETLNDKVDLYVKKHVFKDVNDYSRQTLGDTNLTDYYAKKFGIDYPPTQFNVPADFFEKLWVSPHFAFADYMLPGFVGPFPSQEGRDVDLHARIAVKGSKWYAAMRREAWSKATAWQDKIKVVHEGRVSREEFLAELYRSKLCFSPFGYGEYCWRDFEAMLTGSLLLKQDMSHIKGCPEAFIPFETYVPLSWDLSDFDEKVEYYLNHEKERVTIARNAFELIQSYFLEKKFLQDVQPFLQKLGL